MEHQNDIEKYRKKKKRKKIIRNILLGLGAVILGAIAFFIVQDISKSNSYEEKENPQFPINLRGETPVDLNVLKDSLVVTTEGSVNFYSSLARKQNSLIHGYSKPVTRTSGGYAVTYDQGGYGLRVDTKNGNLGTLKMKNPILFCEINESGQVAIACSDQKYTSGVHIYESDLKESVCSYYMNEYAMAVAFTQKDECVIASQTVSGGDFNTVLYGINFHRDQELFRTEVRGTIALSLGSKDSERLSLVGNHDVVFMDKDGTQIGEYRYQNQLAFFDDSESGYLVIALKDTADPNKTDLLVFYTDGQVAAQTVVSGTVQDLFCKDQSIYLLDETKVYEFNSQLEKVSDYDNNGAYQYLAVLGGNVYVMGNDQLEKLS